MDPFSSRDDTFGSLRLTTSDVCAGGDAVVGGLDVRSLAVATTAAAAGEFLVGSAALVAPSPPDFALAATVDRGPPARAEGATALDSDSVGGLDGVLLDRGCLERVIKDKMPLYYFFARERGGVVRAMSATTSRRGKGVNARAHIRHTHRRRRGVERRDRKNEKVLPRPPLQDRTQSREKLMKNI